MWRVSSIHFSCKRDFTEVTQDVDLGDVIVDYLLGLSPIK